MAWTPLFDTATTAQQLNTLTLLTEQHKILLTMQALTESLNLQLALLNARIEEAFETGITADDI